MKKVISSFVFLLTLGYVETASAATQVTLPGGYNQGGPDTIAALVTRLLGYALGIAALVSLVYIIIGGFNYITSSGNADKVKGAQKTITYAIIGLAVVILAFAIRAFVLDRLFGVSAPQAQI